MFEIGAKFEEGWSSDNRDKPKKTKRELKEPAKHKLHIAKEKRRGKVVTIVKPFYLEDKELKNLLKKLKTSLGCGGTIKENIIELQGEVSVKIKDFLLKEGFKFKN